MTREMAGLAYHAVMAIVGHGVDLTPVERIARLRARHGEHFLIRVFTEAERAFCESRPRRVDEHLAARFAVKEATLKALGTGLRGGIRWTDVSVHREDSGKPHVKLDGKAAEIAERLGIRSWFVSISHAGGSAIASVIAER
jgi:holo-[acyl-carrier protein] synthase